MQSAVSTTTRTKDKFPPAASRVSASRMETLNVRITYVLCCLSGVIWYIKTKGTRDKCLAPHCSYLIT